MTKGGIYSGLKIPLFRSRIASSVSLLNDPFLRTVPQNTPFSVFPVNSPPLECWCLSNSCPNSNTAVLANVKKEKCEKEKFAFATIYKYIYIYNHWVWMLYYTHTHTVHDVSVFMGSKTQKLKQHIPIVSRFRYHQTELQFKELQLSRDTYYSSECGITSWSLEFEINNCNMLF